MYNCIFKEPYLHVDWDLLLEVNITSEYEEGMLLENNHCH